MRATGLALMGLLVAGCVDGADPTPDDDDATAQGDDDSGDDDSGDDDSGDDDSGDDDSGDDDSGDDDDDPCALPATPRDLFDLPAILDPSTLALSVLTTNTVLRNGPLGLPVSIQVQELRYASIESVGCVRRPVMLQAFLAIPTSAVGTSGTLPGVVIAHGLGGMAEAGSATGPAAEHGVVALAYSGPGQGSSDGEGSHPDHLFATVPDPRDSWMWEHPVAAMRGLTLLETVPEVDPQRLGLTGYSGGAVATLVANGVDPRPVAAVPASASGYMDLAISATPTPGWQADLLAAMDPPRDASSPEWAAYETWLDPKRFLATPAGATLLIDGAQDEFFPLNALGATFSDLFAADPRTRLLAIKDWDHGWYALFTGEEAAAMSTAALTSWFGRAFGTVPAMAEAPPRPQALTVIPWFCPFPCAAVAVDTNRGGYTVTGAKVHFSGDSALTFASWNLQDQGGGVWGAEVGTWDAAALPPGTIPHFAEVTYRAGAFGPTFTLTTAPMLPAGFSPNILPIAGPLP